MDILANMYEKPSTSKQIFLLKKMVKMKLTDRGSVAEHINNLTQVTTGIGRHKAGHEAPGLTLSLFPTRQLQDSGARDF